MKVLITRVDGSNPRVRRVEITERHYEPIREHGSNLRKKKKPNGKRMRVGAKRRMRLNGDTHI